MLPPSAPGYGAALVSCLAFGSFCVPMKSEAVRAVNMDPLVFQTYKTVVCFLTSCLLVAAGGVHRLTFTPWGIVSGLFWVPAGVAHTTAVQTAGLAISGATGASVVVLVSFVWGIFIFQERVRSQISACLAIGCMIIGIFGMSFFSSPQIENSKVPYTFSCFLLRSQQQQFDNHGSLQSIPELEDESNDCDDSADLSSLEDGELGEEGKSLHLSFVPCVGQAHCIAEPLHTMAAKQHLSKVAAAADPNEDNDDNNNVMDDKYIPKKAAAAGGTHAIVSALAQYVKRTYGMDLTIRQMGLVVCALGNTWGGSVMVPLKFAGKDAQGIRYVFSFAVGALLVNILLWCVRYYYAYRISKKNLMVAWQSMPPFHFESAALPCSMSGVLWSIGNVGSILSVTYLGEGVGYSLCQSSILVTGCWGIFWFKEITHKSSIHGWLASACLAICGILLLSYNHLPPIPKAILKG